MLRHSAGPCFLLVFASAALAVSLHAQDARSLSRFGAGYGRYPCRSSFRAESTENDRSWQLRDKVPDDPDDSCEPLEQSVAKLPWNSPARSRSGQSQSDPVLDELSAMGAAGLAIAVARQEVIEILREPNACSAWFSGAQPH